MSEIRLRPRQVAFLLIALTIFLFIILSTRKGCQVPEYLSAFKEENDLPIIYAITPTFYRPVQKAELTRLSHVIMLVPNVHWIIIEDALENSSLVANLLQRSGISNRSTLLAAKTPAEFKLKGKDPNWIKPRGVEQRNAGLKWIRKNAPTDRHGIVFFMDDDNTYSVELFREMSKIQPSRVGVWPVGLVGGLMVEKPILDNEYKVVGFNSIWRPERPFPVDMAGFGISVDLIFKRPEAMFSYEVQRGYQESEILRHVTIVNELQPMANLCKDVLVWHTRTETPKLTDEEKLIKAGKPSDAGMEV